MQGPDAARPYAEQHSFLTVVDTENLLGTHFGFTIVPNGIFVDENGKIRLLKQGFHVNNPEHTDAIHKLIHREVETIVLEDVYYEPSNPVAALQKQLASTKLRLALMYQGQGKTEQALEELDAALLLDPENFLIRKQRWFIRHPEKFSPEIDIEWQKVQLQAEREAEALQTGTACGPEGCVIPGT